MKPVRDPDLFPLHDRRNSGQSLSASESGQEKRESAAPTTRILFSSVNIMSISQSGPLCGYRPE